MTPTRLRCGVVCAVDDDAVRRAESTTVHTSVRTRRPDLLVIARTVLLRTSSRMTEASPNATRWHIGLSSYVVRREARTIGRVGAIRYLFPSRRPPARQHPFEVGQHQDVKQFRTWASCITAGSGPVPMCLLKQRVAGSSPARRTSETAESEACPTASRPRRSVTGGPRIGERPHRVIP